jgi:hypothetical protein
METKAKIAVAVTLALLFVFLSLTIFLLAFPRESDPDQTEEKETIEFLTDKTTYESGENITFILLNNGTDNVGYDSELRDTLQIFGLGGQIVVMMPYAQTFAGTTIQPGENLSWTWNQTYYLYVWLWEEEELELTWDYISWRQVPSGKYTAKISHGDIEKEVDFWISE